MKICYDNLDFCRDIDKLLNEWFYLRSVEVDHSDIGFVVYGADGDVVRYGLMDIVGYTRITCRI